MMRFLGALLIAASTLLLAASASPPPAAPPLPKQQAKSDQLWTHGAAFDAAALDTAMLTTTGAIQPEEFCYIRYLSMHNIPAAQRAKAAGVVSVILNGFIKDRDVTVPPIWGGADNPMLRINLFEYGIDPKVWDKLGEKDPYFHEVLWEKPTPTYNQWRKKKVHAAWLNPASTQLLGTKLRTLFPVLRADWFIANVTVEPHYSDFLGIKTLDQLKEFGGFDKRADNAEVKATVVNSGSDGLCTRVSRNNRILTRRPTLWGDWWETSDFKTSTGASNVINNFLNDVKAGKAVFKPVRDAAEYIIRSPNGLQWYMVTDGNDKPLAAGDINIVVDGMADDAQVRNGRSCMWCHSSGINPFKSHFQKQVGGRPDQADLGFYHKDPKTALLIRQKVRDIFGLPDFDKYIKDDSARYNVAVKKCSGMSATEFAAAFKSIWDGYVEARITNAAAAAELGLTEPEMLMILKLRFEGRNNGVLIQALLEPPVAIRRDQWEEAFEEAALLGTLKGKFVPATNVPAGR